ncbi:uncharacterized protein LOC141641646 [Silene latifolia]|uniref:uncharacterized protein LOC141641646 n=1 Tax=Silene latifolia TaxID=37657 RepID=UPI003D7864D6
MASQARLLNLIGHIDNSKDTWRIKVRVARLYEVPSWNKPKEICRIEMILLDEKFTYPRGLGMGYGDTDDDAYLLEEIVVGRSLSIQEEFLSLTKRVQIADIVAIKEPCFCAVVGTIKHVETQHDWFYSSCKLCATKVTMNDNGTFYCFKCKKTVKFVSKRYKVVFKVEDDSGSASLLMFCREMIQLIQKTTVDLRETLIKNGEDGLFPIEFDDLLEKQFLFKLNISEYNLSKNYKVYTVSRITDDPELLSAHFALLQTQENVSDAATATAGTSQTISFINENESVSVIGDNSEMNSSDACNITPSKRGIEEVVPGELYILGDEGQSSAIRPRIVVKVEKDV